MGEERQDAHSTPPGRKLSVSAAASELGISAEAVRSRLKRGTLRGVKEGSTVYVLLEADQPHPGADQTAPEQQPEHDRTALVETLREQIAYLQGVIATRDRELQERTEEARRRDTALERQQELTAMFADRLREIEAPQERQESPQESAEASGGVEDWPASEGPQTVPRRPWWRRWWGR